MGNSNLHNHSHGGVIQFDKPFYYPGELVTGVIYMNIVDMINSRGVELNIKCTEGVKCIERESRTINENGNSRVEWHDVEYKDKQKLYQNKTFLPNFNNNIGIGQYAYPFSFYIPPNMPGSFEYYTSKISSYIKYEVKVKIIPFIDMDRPIKFSTICIVRQNPSFFNYPTNLTDTKRITTWCFFDKGVATLNISYEKNHFAKDEIIQTQCTLNNVRCTLDSTAIRLQLFQKITLRIKGTHVRYFTRLVAENVVNDRCIAGQETLKFINLPIEDRENPTIAHLDKCTHKHLFTDPITISKLQATCKGSLLECEYFLRATTNYDSMLCCSSPPTIDIPIIIYIPNFSFDFNRYRPDNWNPQMMPTYEINNNQPAMMPIDNMNNQGAIPIIQNGNAPIINNFGNISQDNSFPIIQGGTAPVINN